MKWNNFDWESKEQFLGYTAYLKWCNEKGFEDEMRALDLFFIEKDNDFSKWIINLMGDQNQKLENQISLLQKEIRDLKIKLLDLNKVEK